MKTKSAVERLESSVDVSSYEVQQELIVDMWESLLPIVAELETRVQELEKELQGRG